MKYTLNKLPVKTTNHFKINDIELELEEPSYIGYNDLSIQGNVYDLEIERRLVKEPLNTKIGLPISQYMELSITIPKNIQVETPILIDYVFKDNDSFMDKIIFHYEENSHCDFIVTYISADETPHFHHLLEETISMNHSSGSISYINLMNDNSKNMIAIENEVLEKASITHNIIDMGGNVRLYNVNSNLKEYQAKNQLNTIYVGKDNDIIDINYYLKNDAPETTNTMKVEGAINDNCQKNFRGTIDFIKGCANSVGEEQENCVLLSDQACSRSLPQLLCEEENVVGSHGVSSGKVSQEKLFYLMTRGYSEKEAKKLIIMTNFQKIIKEIPSEGVQEFVQNNLESILEK